MQHGLLIVANPGRAMQKSETLMKQLQKVSSRILTAFPYPKLALLVLAVFLAYWLFTLPVVAAFFNNLGIYGYFGIFIGGVLFSFGFTTPFAIGIFATTSPQNIVLAAIIGGVGAAISDLAIFKFIKISFMDEFMRLEKARPLRAVEHAVSKSLTRRLKVYFLYLLAGFIIASPLPDEIGIALLAGLTTIRLRTLACFSFIMNTAGIFVILAIAH